MEDIEKEIIYSLYIGLDKEKLIKLLYLLDDHYIELRKILQEKLNSL